MAENLDPEEVMGIMDGAFDVLIEPVYRHGGTLARLMGDAVLAFFGAPISQEDDPKQAIRAGLEIVDGTRGYAEKLKEEHGIEGFNVRVGINTGLVVVGEVGSDLRVEYTAMGDAINLAARMEKNAPPGGVLITHDTFKLVRGVFDVLPQEPVQVKGKSEPVQTYLVQRAKPRAFRMPTRGVEGIETRMVGRDMELKTLQDAIYTAMEDSEGQIITIVGEAGVGKSRLLYEFTNWIDLLPETVRFYQGRARQEAQSRPYAVLRDLFSFRFLIQEGDTTGEVQEKIETGFGDVFGQDERGIMRAHFIGQLLGFDFGDSSHLKGVLEDAQQLRDRSLIYMDEYFEGVSDEAPVVIYLEEIHWADDSSLDALNHFTRKVGKRRMLILCLSRPVIFERRPHWGEGLEFHHRLEIKPLTKRDSRQLVDEILQRVERVPAALRELVVNGAEGNPFFIEELTKMLLENGVIIKGEERWRVELDRLTEVDVPTTLTGVLQARLDSLPQGERMLLQQASVVGRVFWDRVLEHIATHEEGCLADRGIEQVLSSLRGRELVYQREGSAFANAREYTFKHALLREVTYEGVLKRLRRGYHRLVAEWLIGQRDEYPGLIADHLEKAGEVEKAVEYLEEAGSQAGKHYANTEAVQYYTRALGLIPEADLAKRYKLLLLRENELSLLGDREEQLSDIKKLKQLASSLGDQRRTAEIGLLEIRYLEKIADFPIILEKVEHALHLAQTAGAVEIETELSIIWGHSLLLLRDTGAALEPLERARKLAVSHRLRKLEALCCRRLQRFYAGSLNNSLAEECAQKTLEIYRELGDLRGEATALLNLGAFYTNQIRDFTRAEKYFNQALKINRFTGDLAGQSATLHNLSLSAASRGDYTQAIDLGMQASAITEDVGNKLFDCNTRWRIGSFYSETGHFDQAKSFYNQALSILLQTPNLYHELRITQLLIGYHITLGDSGSAELGYLQIITQMNDLDPTSKIILHMHLGFNKHQLKDDHAALKHTAEAFAILGENIYEDYNWFGHTISGHACTALNDLNRAEQQYKKALDLFSSMFWRRRKYDTFAGLARLELTRGDPVKALSCVEEILSHLETDNLDGTLEPYRIYLTCYQVLRANQDPRKDQILTDAYNLIQERAKNISDESLRGSFLENVAVNREILQEYFTLYPDAASST